MSRLLIDATPVAMDQKGVGTYAQQMCHQLARRLPENWRLLIMVHPGTLPALPEGPRIQLIKTPVTSELALALFHRPAAIRKHQPDAVLLPWDCASARMQCLTIQICHDIDELICANQTETTSIFRRWLDAIKRRGRIASLRRASLVICNSSFTREQVIARYGVRRDRTALGYCGVDETLYEVSRSTDPKSVLNRYMLPRFVLTFSTGDSRENAGIIPDLISQLLKHETPIPLLVAGIQSEKELEHLRNTLIENGAKEGTHFVLERSWMSVAVTN